MESDKVGCVVNISAFHIHLHCYEAVKLVSLVSFVCSHCTFHVILVFTVGKSTLVC